MFEHQHTPCVPTVLIVEDSEQGSAALEIALAAIPGIQVAVASSVEEALRILPGNETFRVCAIVTDLHLGERDGFELIERVRSDPRYAALPIIVVSGDTDHATPTRVFQLGADAFFEKPYSPQRVRERMERLLNANSSRQSV